MNNLNPQPAHTDHAASNNAMADDGLPFNPYSNAVNNHATETRAPLHQHVQEAVEQYFAELEGDMPTHLYDIILQQVEKPLLEVVLEQTQGNQSKSAKVLGLNRGTLRKKMEQYGLL